MKDLKHVFSYIGPYRKDLYIGAFLVFVETCFELIIPVIMADLIDVGVATRDIGYITIKGVQMGTCALLSLITGLLYAKFAARAAYGFGAALREKEYEKVQDFAFSNLDRFETSSLVTRMTTDVTVMQNAINGGLRPLVRSPVMLLMGVGLSIWMNPTLAAIFLVCVPVLAVILFLIVRKIAPLYSPLQKSVDRVNGVVQENLAAIRTVKAFVREEYEEEKFNRVNEELQDRGKNTFKYAVLNLPAFQLTMYSASVLIMWFGGEMIMNHGLEVGELTGFFSYVLQVMNSLMMMSNVFLLLTRSLASSKRICETLGEKPEFSSPQNADFLVTDGSVDFDDVSFKYKANAAEYVLSDINLHIRSGETIGIIGGTGSSKSTLVQLIPRLYDPVSGIVRVGGKNARSYDLDALRSAVGIVLQKNTLFTGTIRENLLWGNKDASEEEILEACRSACADEFIEKMPNGLDTYLGHGGVNVSGGQKQRLCIARALLKNPKILILDDSTSAVDTKTESIIRSSLAGKYSGTTKIIIAQRVSSVRYADRIVIMDDGKIHAVGTHDELLANDSIYKEIYESQTKGGE